MSNIVFAENAWSEYLSWQDVDRKTLKRINVLLRDILRSPYDGIGKPEALRYGDGLWSRRIDEVNRLVYKLADGNVVVLQCRGHYDD